MVVKIGILTENTALSSMIIIYQAYLITVFRLIYSPYRVFPIRTQNYKLNKI